MAETNGCNSRVEIRFSGSGGQGILLAAAIVAEAATALGKHVVQTKSYGPAARGGASKAEAIIADDEIDYPEVDTPDVSLCLSQAAYEKYAKDTRPGGLLVYDSGLAEPGVVHEEPAGARILGVLLVGRLRKTEAHVGRINLWVVDLVVGDDGLGLRGAAARRRPVALGLHDVLAQGRGRLGDDRRRQQDALAARSGEADLDARVAPVGLSHGGPLVPAPARGRARRRTRRARCDAAGPRGTARAGARRPPRTCWLARRAPSGRAGTPRDRRSG